MLGIFGARVGTAYLMPDGTIQALDELGRPITDCIGPARSVIARVLARSTAATAFRRVRADGRQCPRFPWEFEIETLGGSHG